MRILGPVIGTAMLLPLIVMPLAAYIMVEYPYEQKVGAHLENAQEANDPELMLAELNASISGMRELGLTDNMSSAIFFPKPDNLMKFQYQYLTGIGERIESVIVWKNRQNETLNPESLGDVYNAKMENLRSFLSQGGRADWIAKPTNRIMRLGRVGYVLFYPITILGWIFFLVVAIFAFTGGFSQ